jgi:hypothetical protein
MSPRLGTIHVWRDGDWRPVSRPGSPGGQFRRRNPVPIPQRKRLTGRVRRSRELLSGGSVGSETFVDLGTKVADECASRK